eukprot:sb/3477099/
MDSSVMRYGFPSIVAARSETDITDVQQGERRQTTIDRRLTPSLRGNSLRSHSAIAAPRLRNSVRIDRSDVIELSEITSCVVLENKVNQEVLGNGSTESTGSKSNENQLPDS